MDDVVDSRGREAMLPDHSGSVACFNVNMTSIDSGVETGNDSNDSSTVQQEGQQQQAASQIISNGMTAVDSSGEFPKLDMYDWSALMHPLFVPDEARRSSSDVMVLQDRIGLKPNKYLHYEVSTCR